jgi:hypothetical protein
MLPNCVKIRPEAISVQNVRNESIGPTIAQQNYAKAKGTCEKYLRQLN